MHMNFAKLKNPTATQDCKKKKIVFQLKDLGKLINLLIVNNWKGIKNKDNKTKDKTIIKD